MIILLVVTGAILFGIVLMVYDTTARDRITTTMYSRKVGRDMWMNSLLECYHEPTKYRFGPARIIPAESRISEDTR